LPVGIVLWGVRSIYTVSDSTTGDNYTCTIKGKILELEGEDNNQNLTTPLVAGDMVEFSETDHGHGLITARKKRKNEFKRLKQAGRVVQTIVANLDQIIIFDSIDQPRLNTYFIDRCILTADLLDIPVILCINKIDLLPEENREDLDHLVAVYKRIGYPVYTVSVAEGEGLEQVQKLFKGTITSINGRSGVGKSSLIRTLDPRYGDIAVSHINRKYNKGRHCTTYAQVYPLQSGGHVVDTPGVKEFALFVDGPEQVERYFPDFNNIRDNCRFPNCQHINEPDCAVIDAVEKGNIAAIRYESYLRMHESL
jgi:ribosome biogenesis GTPase